jgi:hypothetical protein
VGVANVHEGAESGVWLGNTPGSSPTDSNAVVLLSGPYASDGAATQYAQSLTGVELSASGGRWVASASLRSNLKLLVTDAAACMA